ncbi:MAG: sigma-70 family RNA polymerase sigma factor [Bacteroidales bacterium]|jgi:RNA polymerase sigma-70 factor (ECF subfamily)|nr:sigma-70 family RNA polymerase sigma factor [Bacteroidales bacterium]
MENTSSGRVKTTEHLVNNDQELVEGCIAGNPKYQRILYEEFAGDLYFICKRYSHSDADAEDLLQDAFIKIFLNLKGFRFESSLRHWMKRLATNTIITNFRTKKKEGVKLDYEECEQGVLPVVEVQDVEIPMEVLMRMVRELPPGYRMIFNMREIDGYELSEIAEELNMNPATVRSQLFKAKAVLKKQIENWLKSEKV